MNVTQICICIPARYNSFRLPGKLLKRFDKNGDTVIEMTFHKLLLSKYITQDNIYVFTDDDRITTVMKKHIPEDQIIFTSKECKNALYRLSYYVHLIPERYTCIMDVHADECFIDEHNIDFLIECFLRENTSIVLHRSLNYLKASDLSIIKIVLNDSDEILYCSRAVIPHTKDGIIKEEIDYKAIVGLHILFRETVSDYKRDIKSKSHFYEDIEELRLIELGHRLKSYEVPYACERSLNTIEDYTYFLNKFKSLKKLLDRD